MSSKETQFAESYLTVLRSRLGRPARDGSAPARTLGRQALDAGLGAGEIARAHAKALRTLAPSRYAGNDGGAILRRAERFFLSALTPLQPEQGTMRKTAKRMRSLDALLRRSTAALSVAKQRLRLESARAHRAEVALAEGARHYRRLLAQSESLQDQLRRMARRVLSAQEEERKNISRELHDEIAQVLTGINVQLSILKQDSKVNDSGLRKRIEHAQRFVEKSVTAVHRFARELRPALLDDLGLIPALRSFIRTLPGRRKLRIQFAADAGVEILDNSRRTVLYRVAQEALNNVVRHAHAKLATVRVRKHPHTVELNICDDGRSFVVQRVFGSNTRKHLGLLGMRERVDMVGGTFSVVSEPGKGTTIRAIVPLGRGTRSRTA
jgi:signal transduction histidine kinase